MVATGSAFESLLILCEVLNVCMLYLFLESLCSHKCLIWQQVEVENARKNRRVTIQYCITRRCIWNWIFITSLKIALATNKKLQKIGCSLDHSPYYRPFISKLNLLEDSVGIFSYPVKKSCIINSRLNNPMTRLGKKRLCMSVHLPKIQLNQCRIYDPILDLLCNKPNKPNGLSKIIKQKLLIVIDFYGKLWHV